MGSPTASPRISMGKLPSIAFVCLVLVFGSMAVFGGDPFVRFAAVVLTAAFSFQFWTVATARGERRASVDAA